MERVYDPASAPDWNDGWLYPKRKRARRIFIDAPTFPSARAANTSFDVASDSGNQLALSDRLLIQRRLRRLNSGRAGPPRSRSCGWTRSYFHQLTEAIDHPCMRATSPEAYDAAVVQLTVDGLRRDSNVPRTQRPR